MRKITIIGAGQAGLQLGIGLLGQGYAVRIVSNRSAEQIGAGRVMSSQSMYDMALAFERELGIAFWDDECPPTDGVHMRAGSGDQLLIDWRGLMGAPGQSVDQRIKMPVWMAEFQRRGGELVIEDAGIPELERYAQSSDLVIVSTGKGEIGKLFERDNDLSAFDAPLRTISLTYVHGMKPREDFSALNISINPGIGELVNFPGMTLSGPCDIINLECIPNGPMDRWHEVKSQEEHLALAVQMIEEYFPWEAERCQNLRLTDDQCTLVGRITPTVRKPVGYLPSGRTVLGMADVLVLARDPTTPASAPTCTCNASSTRAGRPSTTRGRMPPSRAIGTTPNGWPSSPTPICCCLPSRYSRCSAPVAACRSWPRTSPTPSTIRRCSPPGTTTARKPSASSPPSTAKPPEGEP